MQLINLTAEPTLSEKAEQARKTLEAIASDPRVKRDCIASSTAEAATNLASVMTRELRERNL